VRTSLLKVSGDIKVGLKDNLISLNHVKEMGEIKSGKIRLSNTFTSAIKYRDAGAIA